MPETKSLIHDWVKYTVQNVAVIVDPFTGASSVVVDEGPEAPIGEQVGCSLCGQPLNDSSAVEPCEGEEWSPSL